MNPEIAPFIGRICKILHIKKMRFHYLHKLEIRDDGSLHDIGPQPNWPYY